MEAESFSSPFEIVARKEKKKNSLEGKKARGKLGSKPSRSCRNSSSKLAEILLLR